MRPLYYALIVLMLISGCAGVPEQTFNSSATSLNSIAIAPPTYEEDLLLRYRNDQIESVDLFSRLPIGKLFTYVAKENRENEFTENAQTASSVFAVNLQQRLNKQLSENDFTVVVATLPDPESLDRDRNNLLKKIPQQAFNGASALLETSGQIGFTAAGRGKPFQPTLWVTVRLTAPDGTILLQDQVLYNPPQNSSRGVLLYPTDEFNFESQDELADMERITAALEQATIQVSEELAFLLRGPLYDLP